MVIVRYQSFAANAVVTHRFQSVALPPLGCDGSRAGIKRCPPLRFFSALSNLVRGACRRFDEGFGSLPFWLNLTAFANRWQRVVRYSRCTFNSFGALAQACKQSSRRFAQSLHSFASVFAHVEQHGRGAMQCPTTALKELTK